MTAFELVAKLTADTSGFDRAMNKADRSGRNLKDSLSGTFGKIKKVVVGALSVAAIKKGIDSVINLANEVSNAGDKIDKQSQVLGMSRKAYQEWDYILGQNGASIDSMSVSMKTLNSAILSAAEGSEEYNEALVRLGLNYVELGDMNMEGQFEAVVRAFQKMPAGAKKSALAVKLFGRNGMELLPLLNQSETSIDELRQRAEELGIIMSDDAVNASVEYNDAMDDLNRTFNGIKNTFGAKLLPTFTSGVKKITAYAGKISKAYQKSGISGVWDTLVSDFKKIKWPSAAELVEKIKTIWNGVTERVQTILKLFFGETEDGGIAFPSPEQLWNKIKGTLTTVWDYVKDAAGGILKFAFGETEDGGIAWPSGEQIWAKIQGGFETMWSYIKTAAGGIMKLIFGETEDGGIAFPSATDVFAKISSTLDTWWTELKGYIEGKLKIILGIPELPDAYTAGQLLKAKIDEWWKAVWVALANVITWFLPNPSMEDEDGSQLQKAIQDWWDTKVKPELKNILNFTLGLFGLPSVDEMKQKIVQWWTDVVAAVGDLVLNIIPKILGFNDGNSEWNGWNGQAPEPHSWYVGEHAKGLASVPYDNYPALLHRGEQVLTASQARHQESGSTLDLNGLASAVEAAIKSGMENVTVRSYLNGRNVTEEVNRTQIKQLKARRYAT